DAKKLVFLLKIDPGSSPKAIDEEHVSGALKGKTLHGIYKLEGDTLTTCYKVEGDGRPAQFASKTGSGALLIVSKRAPFVDLSKAGLVGMKTDDRANVAIDPKGVPEVPDSSELDRKRKSEFGFFDADAWPFPLNLILKLPGGGLLLFVLVVVGCSSFAWRFARWLNKERSKPA